MSNLHFLEHKIHALNCCLLSLLFCHSYWNPMGTENVIMEENEWRGGAAGIIVSYWHCYCAVSVYQCIALLCATSVWRPQRRGDTWTRVTLALVRHCNLAHRSHHTPHNTTHCLHYTQPFEHLDTSIRRLTWPASYPVEQLTWQFKVQNPSALSTISQLSRSSSANMKCGSYEVYSPLIFAKFCTVFYLSFRLLATTYF